MPASGRNANRPFKVDKHSGRAELLPGQKVRSSRLLPARKRPPERKSERKLVPKDCSARMRFRAVFMAGMEVMPGEYAQALALQGAGMCVTAHGRPTVEAEAETEE
jgi:hypothetical protein